MIMKAKEYIEKPRTGKWIKRMALAAAAFIVFSYLYSRGNFAGMDGSRHRLFQGILQVPL